MSNTLKALAIAKRNVTYWQARWGAYVSREHYSFRHAAALEYMLRNAQAYLKQIAGTEAI